MNIRSTKLGAFIRRHLKNEVEPTDKTHQLQLACAALMCEMLRVDDDISNQEEEKLFDIIKDRFEFTEEETDELIGLARDKMYEATDYYQFTSLINSHFSQNEKRTLVKNLWEIAYSDGILDRYEEHLVRNLAELLHVPHSSFIQMKHSVEKS